MRNNLSFLSFLINFLLCFFLFTQSYCYADLNQNILNKSIQNLIQENTPEASVGVLVEQADTGKIIYSYNADHTYIPASTAKLLTGIAALKELGNSYQFITSISASSNKIIDHNLNSDIYIKFSGDPSFSSDDLKNLISSFKANFKADGIQTISGNIILDTSDYAGAPYPLGIVHDDLPYCFMAPIQAIIINQNCINFSVNLNKNNQMIISKQADAEGFSIINHLVQIPGKNEPETCTFYPSIDQNNQVILEGCLSAKENLNFSFAINNPSLYAAKIIQESLAENHIVLTGVIKTGLAPKNVKLLAKHNSAPLINLVSLMLTTSNDLYAGSLTRKIGLAYYGVGTNKAGVNAIKIITANLIGQPYEYLNFEDGAGLSRYDEITPKELVDLLQAAYKNNDLKNALFISLPRSGMTGTLKYRLGSSPLLGNVYAKTGTMGGVSTLAGYIKTHRNNSYIFAIMVNGLTQPIHQAHVLQDAILGLINAQ